MVDQSHCENTIKFEPNPNNDGCQATSRCYRSYTKTGIPHTLEVSDAMIPFSISKKLTPMVDTKYGKYPRGSTLAHQQKLHDSFIMNFTKPDTFPALPLKNVMSGDIPDLSEENLLTSLKVPQQKSVEIERDTRLQLNCPLWHKLQQHRITASVVADVAKRKKGNAMFLARGRAEYAALSPLEKQKLAREAATPALPSTLEEKKKYLKQLVQQLRKVEKVLSHIGVAYYFEMELDDMNHVLPHDNIYRNVLAERPSIPYDIKYLRQCVQKIFNDSYGRALGKEDCNSCFPYKKHFLALVVKVAGMPEGVQFKHPADSSCPEKKGSSLPKMSRTQRSNLTLRQFTPPDIVNETPSYSLVSSPLEEEAFNYEGLDRESGNTEDDVVTRNAANMDTARALIFIPQPSTSREEEQPSTSRQADVRAVETNDITVSSGSATGGIRQASFAMDNVRLLNKVS